MQLLYHLLRGDADSTDEQFGAALDDDVREGGELTLRIVVLGRYHSV